MTNVDQKCSIYSNHILDFIFDDRCVSVVDKTDFDYKPPIAAFAKSIVATKRHSERLNRPANSVALFERENSCKNLSVSLLRSDHSNHMKKMRLSNGEQSNPGPSAEELKSDPKINSAQCAVLLEPNITNSVDVDTEIAKKKRGRRPKSVFTPVETNKRKRAYKRKPDRPHNIQYIPLGSKTETCKNEGPKMFPEQQLSKDTPKEENSNVYIPVSNSKTPICVLKKKNCTKNSKVDNTDIIYSSSIRNIEGKQVPKIVLVKERANNKIVAIQKNDDTTELHIEEVNTSATNTNDNFKSDLVGKHILPMRISERRSIAEPLRPQPPTLVPDMTESQPKLNEENVRHPENQQIQNIKEDFNTRKVGEVTNVALTKNVVETSDDVPEDLSIKSTRCSRDQNIKPANRLTSRNPQVFSSEKDRVLPNPSLSSRKYFGPPLLQQPLQQQLQVPQQSPRQLSDAQSNQQSPIQKLFIQSPQQSPQQMYLQSALQNYPLRPHIRPPQLQQYLQTPQHSPILQHQHSPLQQMQPQFINSQTYQPRMQYMMQHQAANSMGRQGPLVNPMVRQQPPTMSPQDQQLMMQMMMQQQYPAMQLLNEQQRIVQPLLQSQQHQITQQMVQQQMAELQQPILQSFSPQQQQQLLAQQAMKRQNENNILLGNRQPDAFRRYPYLSGVPFAPYPHQIRKPPINSPGNQYNSDNSQEYWYNLNAYPTNLQNKNLPNMPEIFETNVFQNKTNPKKRNANTAKAANKSTFDEPPSKIKRPNVRTDFAQDFSNTNANYKPMFSNEERSNGAETYHMQPTNSGTTISISSSKNTTALKNEGSQVVDFASRNPLHTGRNREVFENITLQNPFNTTPHEENARNFSILHDGKSKLNEFGEYFLNNTEVTIRKLKANENCGGSTLPPLSSASIYNVQNCSNKASSAGLKREKNMLRTALSSNKPDANKTNSVENDLKNKISASTYDSEEFDELYQNYVSKDIDPLVTTLSNANKRKLFQLSYFMNKRTRVDVPNESNRQIIVKNDIASSGCIVTDKNDILNEEQKNETIKIITSERESGGNESSVVDDIGDSQDSPNSNDTEDLLIIDEDRVVDLSISPHKNDEATFIKVQEDNFLPTDIISTQIVPKATEIDDNHNVVQEEDGSSSPKRTIEEELTLLEQVLSSTKVIQTKPNLTRELNNNSSPSLSETVQELSHALSDQYVENSVTSKLNEECSPTAIDTEVLPKESVAEKEGGIKKQISDSIVENEESSSLTIVEQIITVVNKEKIDSSNEILLAKELEEETSHERLESEETDDKACENAVNTDEPTDESNEILFTPEMEKSHAELECENQVNTELTDEPNEILLTPEMEKEKSHEELECENEVDSCEKDVNTELTDEPNEIFLTPEMEKETSHEELGCEKSDDKSCENEGNTEQTDELNEILLTTEMETEKLQEELEHEELDDESCENEVISDQIDQPNEVLFTSEIEKYESFEGLEYENPHEKLCENEINTEQTDQPNEILVTIEVETEKLPEESECGDVEKSCERISEETNSQEMVTKETSDEGNVNSSESNKIVAAAEQPDVIIEIDDDTEQSDYTKQNFVISRDIDSMNIVEVTVTEDATSEAPPAQSIIACYSVDSSDDSSDDDDDVRQSNNEQHEIISISSDSESEPEYVDETVIDGSFRNELQRKFFLKKFKPPDRRRTSCELMHLISNVFHVYIGLDNSGNSNNPSEPSSSSTSVPINAINSSNITSQANSSDDIHQGNVNNSNKPAKTVLPEFDSNKVLRQRNTKIFLKRCFNIQLYKFKMNIPEAIVCLKYMMRTISTFVVSLPEAQFRFILECKDVIEDYYIHKYFQTLYTPRTDGSMLIVRLDENENDNSMAVVRINSRGSNYRETAQHEEESNQNDEEENCSSPRSNNLLAIQYGEENEGITESVSLNMEMKSSDEENCSRLLEITDSVLPTPSTDENVEIVRSTPSGLKRKLQDEEKYNSDFENPTDSEEDISDNPDLSNKIENLEEDINNNAGSVSNKILVENTDFHSENEQITDNLQTGKHLKMKKRFYKKHKEKSNEIDNCESFSDKENDIDNENHVNEVKSAGLTLNNDNDESQREVKILHRQISNTNLSDANVSPNLSRRKTNDTPPQICSKNDENRTAPEQTVSKALVCLSDVSKESLQNFNLENLNSRCYDNSFEFFEDELISCLENESSKSLVGSNNGKNSEVFPTSKNFFEDCKVFNIQLSRSISIPKSLFQFNSLNLKDVYKENKKITILSKVVLEANPQEILKKYLGSNNCNSKKDCDQLELHKENAVAVMGFDQNSSHEIVARNYARSSQNNCNVSNQHENLFQVAKPSGSGEESNGWKYQNPNSFLNTGTVNYPTNALNPQIPTSTTTVLPQQRPEYYYQNFPPHNAQRGQTYQNYPNSQFKQPDIPIAHQNAQSASFPNCSTIGNNFEVLKMPELVAAPPHVDSNHAKHNIASSYNKEVDHCNERRSQQPKKFNKCYPHSRTKIVNVNENRYNYYQQPPQSVPEPEPMPFSTSSWNNSIEPVNQNNSFPVQNNFSNMVASFSHNNQQNQNVAIQKMQFLLSILHRGDILSPEEYVREIQILQYHQCPRILLDFYTFITKSQIYVNVFPISFRLFLEYHYAGKLKELEVSFVRYVESHERERQQRLKKF